MKRRQLLRGGGTVAVATLAGCLGSAQEDDGDPSSASNPQSRTITVRKSGEVDAEPDLAVLQVGVEVTGESADTVRDELAERSDALKSALLDYGLDEDDITTDRYHIRERVDHRRMERDGVDPRSREDIEEYVHYVGTHSFSVDVHDVDEAGTVIDTAVDAGADHVGRIEFTLSDEKRTELREKALDEALDNARSEAEFVADEVGASIVEARTIDTSGGSVHPVRERVAMDSAGGDAAAPTNLHPDDVTVHATVTVEYRMA